MTFWWVVLAIAVIPRALVAAAALRAQPFDKYLWAAGEIVAGRGLGERLLDFSPLTLGVHVLARRALDDPAAALCVAQGALGVAAALLVAWAAREAAGRAGGVIAALLYSTYPELLAHEATLEPEAFALFFVACLLYLSAAARGRVGAVLLGLSVGLGVATRPNLILILPVLFVPLLAPEASRAAWRIGRGARAALFAVGLAAGCAPLLAALARGGGGLSEAMSGGQVFHQGSNPDSRGIGSAYPALFLEMPERFLMAGDYAHEMYREIAAADLGRPVSAIEADRLWRARAIAFIRSEPLSWLRLEARKAILFFSGLEAQDVPTAANLAARARRAAPLSFGVLASLGLFGAALACRATRRHAVALGLLAVYFVSALYLFVTTRQRLPAAAPLAFFSALGAVWTARAAAGRRARALLLPAAALALAALGRLETPLVRGYRADFEVSRRAEALVAEARAAYGSARPADYRRLAREAAFLSPELLAYMPGLDAEATRDAMPSAEPAITRAIESAGRREQDFLVGRYYAAAGEDHGAYGRLRGLERHPWFGANAANLRARVAIRTGRESEALAILDGARPASPAGGALRAALLDRAGDPRGAAERRRLVALFGETATAYEIGRARRDLGDLAAARAEFEEVVRRFPVFTRAHLHLAEAALRAGDDAAALAAYDAALALDPGAYFAPLRISEPLARRAETAPGDRATRARLGGALLHEAHPERAVRVLAALLAEDPANDAVRLDLARAFAELGRMADARAVAAPLGAGR
jgi:tetratricopeptide (TPR) repeat protein